MNLIERINDLGISEEWLKIFRKSHIESFQEGESGIETYKMICNEKENIYVIKLVKNKIEIESIKYEDSILNKLYGKNIAPKHLYSLFSDTKGISIREYINGRPINKSGLSINEMTNKCCKLMREIHLLNIDFDQIKRYDLKVEEARLRVINGLVNEDDFEEEYLKYSSVELLDFFMKLECDLECNTFTHGDFTFDNIILDGSNVKMIDWGNAQISDPYQDISLLLREIHHFNSSIDIKEMNKIIIKSCGLNLIDDNKLRKFTILDEFS